MDEDNDAVKFHLLPLMIHILNSHSFIYRSNPHIYFNVVYVTIKKILIIIFLLPCH